MKSAKRPSVCCNDAVVDRQGLIADRLIECFGGLVKSITFPVPADAGEDAAARRAIRRLQGRD